MGRLSLTDFRRCQDAGFFEVCFSEIRGQFRATGSELSSFPEGIEKVKGSAIVQYVQTPCLTQTTLHESMKGVACA